MKVVAAVALPEVWIRVLTYTVQVEAAGVAAYFLVSNSNTTVWETVGANSGSSGDAISTGSGLDRILNGIGTFVAALAENAATSFFSSRRRRTKSQKGKTWILRIAA
jgi:hypothetical protein